MSNCETSCFSDQTTAPAWRSAERSDMLDIGFQSFGSRRADAGRPLKVLRGVPVYRRAGFERIRLHCQAYGIASISQVRLSRPDRRLGLRADLLRLSRHLVNNARNRAGSAWYMVAHNNFDVLAVANIDWAGSTRNASRKAGRGAVGPPCLVLSDPSVSCAILDDDWQRFTGAESQYHRGAGREASRRSAACRRHVAGPGFGCEPQPGLLLDRRRSARHR